ncbi:MAG: hypothetical protein V4592_04760 [Bacteroidota bacterium]
MTIQELQEQVSKNLSHGKLTINNSLLVLTKSSSFFDQYQIQSIDCTGASVGSITGSQFTVSTTDVSLKFGWDKNFDIGAATITFFVDNDGNAQISFTYNLQDANLSQILTQYFDLAIDGYIPVFIAELPIENPALTISTSPATLQFAYTVSPSIFPQVTINDLSVSLAIGVADSKYTLTAGGSFSIGDQQFSGSITDSSLTANWSGSESFDLLQDFIPAMGFSPLYTLGDFDNIDLTLTLASASFTYNTSGQLNFTATTTGGLDVYLGATGQAEYCAAVYLGTGADLSTLSTDLSIFTGVTLDTLLVAISGYESDSFSIPNTNYTDIQPGIQILASLTMASADSGGIMDGALGYLSGVFGNDPINVAIGYNDGDFSLTGSVAGPFDFPTAKNGNCTINDISLTISSEAPQIVLGCGVNVYYDFSEDVPELTVQGDVSFSCEDGEATLAFSIVETTTLTNPFGIQGLTVSNIGFAFEGSVGGEESLTLEIQGDFAIANITEDIAASVSLIDGVINIPYFSTSTVGPLTMAEIWTDLITNVTLKSAPTWLESIVINQLNFYFCDQPNVVLPNGQTAAIGTNFMANVSFGNIETYASLSLSTTAIQGTLETSPIYLPSSSPIVSVTGNGQGNSTYGILAGGPIITFNTDTESFSASVDANILGLTENITASLSNGVLSVNFSQSFDNFADDSFTANFSSLDDMSLACSINIAAFSCQPSVPSLGTINISGSLTGDLNVAFVNGIFSASINCNIMWCGHNVNIVADITENFSGLTDIVSAITSAIEQQAKSLFPPFITTAAEYIEAIVGNAIQNDENVLNLLVSTFDVAENDFYTLLNAVEQICKTGHVDYNISFSIDIDIPVGKNPVTVNTPHVDAGPVNESFSFTVPIPSFTIPVLDIHASQHFDLSTTAIHVDFSEGFPNISIPVIDLVVASADVTPIVNVDAGATIPLSEFFSSGNTINTGIDLNLKAKIGIKLSIEVLDDTIWSSHFSTTASLNL